MRRVAILMLVALLVVALVGDVAIAKKGKAKKVKAKAKVVLCHKADQEDPHTITVAESAMNAHLAHGDVVGECEEITPPPPPPPLPPPE